MDVFSSENIRIDFKEIVINLSKGMMFKKLSFYVTVVLVFTLFSNCHKAPKLNNQTVAIAGDYSIPFKAYKERYAN